MSEFDQRVTLPARQGGRAGAHPQVAGRGRRCAGDGRGGRDGPAVPGRSPGQRVGGHHHAGRRPAQPLDGPRDREHRGQLDRRPVARRRDRGRRWRPGAGGPTGRWQLPRRSRRRTRWSGRLPPRSRPWSTRRSASASHRSPCRRRSTSRRWRNRSPPTHRSPIDLHAGQCPPELRGARWGGRSPMPAAFPERPPTFPACHLHPAGRRSLARSCRLARPRRFARPGRLGEPAGLGHTGGRLRKRRTSR